MKKIKRQVTHKILIMFYHLTAMKIRIIKKFHIRRTIKIGHGNSGFGGSNIIAPEDLTMIPLLSDTLDEL